MVLCSSLLLVLVAIFEGNHPPSHQSLCLKRGWSPERTICLSFKQGLWSVVLSISSINMVTILTSFYDPASRFLVILHSAYVTWYLSLHLIIYALIIAAFTLSSIMFSFLMSVCFFLVFLLMYCLTSAAFSLFQTSLSTWHRFWKEAMKFLNCLWMCETLLWKFNMHIRRVKISEVSSKNFLITCWLLSLLTSIICIAANVIRSLTLILVLSSWLFPILLLYFLNTRPNVKVQ